MEESVRMLRDSLSSLLRADLYIEFIFYLPYMIEKRFKVLVAEQHYHKMLVAVKTLHVSLASFRFATYLKNLSLSSNFNT